MWSIGDMKARGWAWVRRIFGPAYVACLIGFIFEGLRNDQMNPLFTAAAANPWLDRLEALGPFQQIVLFLSFSSMALFFGLAGLVLKYFVLNPLEAGLCRYFLKSREMGTDAGPGTVFSVFSCGSYLNVVKILFLRDVYTFLWTLLLIVPGIYKSFEYKMIPWLLAEYPEMSSREAFGRTKELMDGNRFQGFLLDLSFLGWNILAIIAGSILGRLFGAAVVPVLGVAGACLPAWIEGLILLLVSPYREAAWTELYLYLHHHPEVMDENGFRVC